MEIRTPRETEVDPVGGMTPEGKTEVFTPGMSEISAKIGIGQVEIIETGPIRGKEIDALGVIPPTLIQCELGMGQGKLDLEVKTAGLTVMLD